MSLGLQINVRDGASAGLGLFLDSVKGDAMKRAMARGAANVLKDRFHALNSERHRSQVPGRGFYRQVADSLNQPKAVTTTTQGFNLSINHVGIRQRIEGGVIEAGKGTSSTSGAKTKFLSIPVNPEAYGRRPSEFSNLKFIPSGKSGKGDTAILAAIGGAGARRGKTIGGKKAGSYTDLNRLVVMYVLVRRVHQDPDPSILPSPAALLAGALSGGGNYLKSVLDRTKN